MKLLFIFCAFVCILPCYAQPSQKPACLTVSYTEFARPYEECSYPSDCRMQLNILGNKSVYGMSHDDKDCNPNTSPRYFKNCPIEGDLTFTGELCIPVTYTEPLPQMDWGLEEGDTTICDYKCQKARTTFRGRTWTAWYTIDIAISDGPWKLCGLPGLILKAEDSKGDFSFSAYKIKKGQEKDIKCEKTGFMKITARQMAKDLTEYYKDANAYYEAVTGRKTNVYIEGVEYKQPSRTACLLEYFDKE